MEEQTKNKSYLWIGVALVVLLLAVSLYKVASAKPLIKTTESKPDQTTTQPSVSTTPTESPKIASAEVAKHSTKDNCWVIVDGKVYDVTKIIPVHKGGEKAITTWCGKDASEAFNKRGGNGPHPASAMDILTKTLMGFFEVK